jgi:hypothetical protein
MMQNSRPVKSLSDGGIGGTPTISTPYIIGYSAVVLFIFFRKEENPQKLSLQHIFTWQLPKQQT